MQLYYWTECIKVIQALCLMKSFRNKPSLIVVNGVVWLAFKYKHPLTPNNMPIGWCKSKCPSVVMNENLIFNFHGFLPFRVFESLLVGVGFNSFGC